MLKFVQILEFVLSGAPSKINCEFRCTFNQQIEIFLLDHPFKMGKKTPQLLSIFDQKNETLKCLKKKVL